MRMRSIGTSQGCAESLTGMLKIVESFLVIWVTLLVVGKLEDVRWRGGYGGVMNSIAETLLIQARRYPHLGVAQSFRLTLDDCGKTPRMPRRYISACLERQVDCEADFHSIKELETITTTTTTTTLQLIIHDISHTHTSIIISTIRNIQSINQSTKMLCIRRLHPAKSATLPPVSTFSPAIPFLPRPISSFSSRHLLTCD